MTDHKPDTLGKVARRSLVARGGMLDPDPLYVAGQLNGIAQGAEVMAEAMDMAWEGGRKSSRRLPFLLGIAVGVLVTIASMFVLRPVATASEASGTGGVIGGPATSPGATVAAPLVPAAPLPDEMPPDSAPAVEGGIASYVNPKYGPRYLALPDGPGITVTIYGPAGQVTRTSTDAGPDKAMQRAGRVADVSYADFRTLCGCTPELVGLIRVTVEYGDSTVTIPPTDR